MKFSVFIASSMDGFIAREDGSLDWLPGSGADNVAVEDHGYGNFYASVDALVMGRKTFETVLNFGVWPYDKPVFILSQSLKQLPPGFSSKAEIHPGPLQQLVQDLARNNFKHIYVDGGKTIQSFLSAGLIDKIIITRIPILIGKGIPLFGELQNDIKLKHLSTIAYPNGMVQSTYQTEK